MITEQGLFKALARPDRKGDPAPSLFRLSLILQELKRRKAFSIYWAKDGQPLRIDVNEVFLFLQGWQSAIKPAVTSKDYE